MNRNQSTITLQVEWVKPHSFMNKYQLVLCDTYPRNLASWIGEINKYEDGWHWSLHLKSGGPYRYLKGAKVALLKRWDRTTKLPNRLKWGLQASRKGRP